MGLLQLVGKVVSDKMTKTVTVAVTNKFKVAKIGKFVRRTKKYMAHDEVETCRTGDTVKIIETRPMSRHKRFNVLEVLERAPVFPDLPTRLAAASAASAAGKQGGSLLPPAAAAAAKSA